MSSTRSASSCLRAIDGVTRVADLCARLAAAIFARRRRHRARRDDAVARSRRQATAARRSRCILAAGGFDFRVVDRALRRRTGRASRRAHASLPLQCPYCSNPLDLERANAELTADEWGETFRQAASIGALQLHLSGGEPTARRDLEEILAHAVDAGLYTNLVTSAVLLTRERLQRLAEIGLDHVQVSIQDVVPESADRISGYEGGVAKKRDVARWTRELGIGLTINAPMHRQNIAHLPQIIDFAVDVDAQRIEIAHIQYYAWARDESRRAHTDARRLHGNRRTSSRPRRSVSPGVLNFDFVIHDHYATRPKACTGGWGRSIMAVTPSGKALPCHAAQTLPGLVFDNVRERPLGDIWRNGAAFNAFRGTDWMKEPCRSCDRREIDFGGCRCQAFAVTGDAAATDPACHLSPDHARFAALAEVEVARAGAAFVYRRYRRRRGSGGAREGAGLTISRRAAIVQSERSSGARIRLSSANVVDAKQ